jgi:hypothetical protein
MSARGKILSVLALASGLALAGCESMDFMDVFSQKKPLPGERRAVFPEGVPGVPQGVPREMTKGYQPPPEAPPPVIEAKQPRQKAKKTASAPRRAPPKQQIEEPTEPQMQQAPAARTTTQPVQQGAGSWQTIPGSQPTWPTDAQPAPRR